MLDIMKAVDEQLQVVIDGTMEENKKEEDIETRRYGEGFCAGIELAQRYIRNADIKRYECIIDSEGYERCSHCNEHETGMRYFTFCPRCGVKLKHFETEGKVLAVGLGGSFKDSLIKTEVDGLFLNFEQEG